MRNSDFGLRNFFANFFILHSELRTPNSYCHSSIFCKLDPVIHKVKKYLNQSISVCFYLKNLRRYLFFEIEPLTSNFISQGCKDCIHHVIKIDILLFYLYISEFYPREGKKIIHKRVQTFTMVLYRIKELRGILPVVNRSFKEGFCKTFYCSNWCLYFMGDICYKILSHIFKLSESCNIMKCQHYP